MKPGSTDFTGFTGDSAGVGSSYMGTVDEFVLKAIYRVTEVAKLLGIPQQTVSDWADKGTLATVMVGSGRFVPLSALRQSGELWESIVLRHKLNAGRASE